MVAHETHLKSGEFTQLRQKFIDTRLLLTGSISRIELMRAFLVSAPTASSDLARYAREYPHNAKYDVSKRRYFVLPTFHPSCAHDSNALLSGLRDAALSNEPLFCNPGGGQIFSTESANILRMPSPDIIGSLSRAITSKACVKVLYTSISSGQEERLLVPHSFFTTGIKWYVRAYSLEHSEFRTYSLHRFSTITQLDQIVPNAASIGFDDEWNHYVIIRLGAHPSLKDPRFLLDEYITTDNEIELRLRSCMIGMLMKTYSVDCSGDHSLDPEIYHLIIKNQSILANIPSAVLAPGYLSASELEKEKKS